MAGDLRTPERTIRIEAGVFKGQHAVKMVMGDREYLLSDQGARELAEGLVAAAGPLVVQ